jgi:hypothetical protein
LTKNTFLNPDFLNISNFFEAVMKVEEHKLNPHFNKEEYIRELEREIKEKPELYRIEIKKFELKIIKNINILEDASQSASVSPASLTSKPKNKTKKAKPAPEPEPAPEPAPEPIKALKDCPDGKVRNPKTGRCIKNKTKKAEPNPEPAHEPVPEPEPAPEPAPKSIKALKDCPDGKVRNPKTGRCIKNKTKKAKSAPEPAPAPEPIKALKDCPEGKIRNPKTGRCIKIKK